MLVYELKNVCTHVHTVIYKLFIYYYYIWACRMYLKISKLPLNIHKPGNVWADVIAVFIKGTKSMDMTLNFVGVTRLFAATHFWTPNLSYPKADCAF